MKKFFIILFALFSTSFVYSENFTISKETSRFFSELNKEFLEEFEEEGWVIFVKEFGEEKFEVALPESPELSYRKEGGEEIFHYLSSEENVSYSIVFEEPHADFSGYLDELRDKGELVSYSEKQSEFGPVLDLEYRVNNSYFLERVIAHPTKSIRLITKGGDKVIHASFVASFGVFQRLSG